MEIKEVISKKEIEVLRSQNALAIEGLSVDEYSLKDFEEWVGQYTSIKNLVFNIITGRVINNCYNLTGANRYPDYSIIVSISGIDLPPTTISRFGVKVSELDNIISNMLSRQNQ